MHYRTEPLIQAAPGLDSYYDFSKQEDIDRHRVHLSVSNLYNGKLPDTVKISWIDLNGVRAAKISIDGADQSKLLFHIHGGAFNGGVPCTQQQAMIDILQAVKVNIISVDYGLAPEHPFPDGLNDCVAAYKGALAMGYDHQNIVMIGESAGGNLSLALSLYLKEHGLPLPAALVMISPVVQFPDHEQLSLAYEAHPENKKLHETLMTLEMYIGKNSINDPYISPIQGDLNGIPPMFIQCGGSEPFAKQCADCAAAAVAADVDVALHVWRYMPHVFVLDNNIPEAIPARAEIADYLHQVYYGR